MADSNDDEFVDKIAILKSMFGESVTEDVICAVIESFDGNVYQAADAIMTLTNETDSDTKKDTEVDSMPSSNDTEANTTPVSQSQSQSHTDTTTANHPQQQEKITTFAEAMRTASTGAYPKTSTKGNPSEIGRYHIDFWSEQLKQIYHYHNQGTRTLILLRGAPGSGKSYLARYIIDTTLGPSQQNYDNHIFSSDNYFMRGGVYRFNRDLLDAAHMTNQRLVSDATNKGVSPIIVDNTNIALWEMEPYARDGIRNGYKIMIVEPNTPWSKNATQLSIRNIHNVSLDSIRRMLNKYEKCTVDSLIKNLGLSYPRNMKPPVKRKIPPFIPLTDEIPSLSAENQKIKQNPVHQNVAAKLFPEFWKSANLERDNTQLATISKAEYVKNDSSGASCTNVEVMHSENPSSPDVPKNTLPEVAKTNEVNSDNDEVTKEEDEIMQQKIRDAQKDMELLEKLEQEWEKGESWNTAVSTSNKTSQPSVIDVEPKPPREAELIESEHLITPGSIQNDWSKITLFLPPWQDKPSNPITTTDDVPAPTQDANTSYETSDFKNDSLRVVVAKSRDINEINNYQKTPIKRQTKIMVDNSTTTHDNDFHTESMSDCKNIEQHFRAFRRLFGEISKDVLRDVFDSCCGDVNWAVNIILDSYPEIKIHNANTEAVSESEEESTEECNCLAAYNIIPNAVEHSPAPNFSETSVQSSPMVQKKPKPEQKISEDSLELKRHIENNVMISDSHYSQHYLDTRRRRQNKYADRGLTVSDVLPNGQVNTKYEPGTEENAIALPSSSMPYNLQFNPDGSDTEESDVNDSENDTLVSVNIGDEFKNKLDELFGMEGFPYPENIKPVVNMPMSLLREINAYWQESLAFQMEENAKKAEDMIKQDEEFARQLATKEQEMARIGQKAEMPSLKEIMDMEMAYTIYEKNVSEWRNNEPQDLASRLSREKLYNLFPEIKHEILSELLMAHEYNFKGTVESLLISTGRPELLEEENGVEKYVMQKEMERKEKYLEEEKQALGQDTWPFTTEPDRPVTLETVEHFRNEAEKNLQYRNTNFNKARVYFDRNIPSAATFFSQIAALHTQKYEHNSALAAAYLMSYPEYCFVAEYFTALRSNVTFIRMPFTRLPFAIVIIPNELVRLVQNKLYHMNQNPNQDVVDLHFLRVAEALVTMDLFIDKIIMQLREERQPPKPIYIITGRGHHSNNRIARIKPAAKRRLRARGIIFKEINPGLLSGKINSCHRMTNELPT